MKLALLTGSGSPSARMRASITIILSFATIDFEFSSISKITKEQNLNEEEAYSKYFDSVFMVTNAQTSILGRVNDFVKQKNQFISYEYVPTTGRKKG